MLVLVITLIVFLPVAVLPLALETGFTSRELNEMGVCLEQSQSPQPPPSAPRRSTNSPQICHSCLPTSLSI